ncbi:stathmin-1-A-like [Condylostylus longicornis]|uniref:stathmin-1-A-like n=1 Tax=Condylostylus longicornis TaxID=2530218 RepID=UPI00244DC984|nr:stathmin-1-A-like [Condylostylus longicornis]
MASETKENIEQVPEIRSEGKSKGGLSFEVILSNPATTDVKLPVRPTTPVKNVSAEEIEQKLKAAEERRISLEAKKMADLSNKLAKIEEASRKKDELNQEFIIQSKEALVTKLEKHTEKREEIITSIKEKLKIHSLEIEKTRNSFEQQKENEKAAIEEKLKIAETLREENKKKMLDRLKEHNTIKIAEVKNQIEEIVAQKTEEQSKIIETKLTTAEQNREREIQKKIEKIREHEKRAEIVRQNKAATATVESVETNATAATE